MKFTEHSNNDGFFAQPSPCPFCNALAILIEHKGWFGFGIHAWSVECNGDDCILFGIPMRKSMTRQAALDSWNKRPVATFEVVEMDQDDNSQST